MFFLQDTFLLLTFSEEFKFHLTAIHAFNLCPASFKLGLDFLCFLLVNCMFFLACPQHPLLLTTTAVKHAQNLYRGLNDHRPV